MVKNIPCVLVCELDWNWDSALLDRALGLANNILSFSSCDVHFIRNNWAQITKNF